jgi:hypothetical protein
MGYQSKELALAVAGADTGGESDGDEGRGERLRSVHKGW